MWRQMMSRRAAPMVGGAMGLILLGCVLGCCCLGLICCVRSRQLRRKAMTANAGVPMLSSQDGPAAAAFAQPRV
jgi:cell division protein FtsN